jgi:hypothetical protein
MKNEHVAVLIFGYDKCLLETRQWVLQTRGYRAMIALELSQIEALPSTRRVDLLLICHSVSDSERDAAIAIAETRWPGCRHLALAADHGRMPTGILGQLLHTMDGPARLISLVGSALEDPAPPQARAS